LEFAAAFIAQDQTFIAIGTGGVTGVYYPTGGAICRLVNRDRSEHGIRCGVESTGGSVFNINAIRGGELEFGVAQSDWQYHAYNGTSRFEEQGAFEGLRAVFSVHPEPFTVVARADAGIDLRGPQGQARERRQPGLRPARHHGSADGCHGLDDGRLRVASELQAAEQSQALCDNNIDAMIYTVGHPSGSIQEATTACDSKLVDVTGRGDRRAGRGEPVLPHRGDPRRHVSRQ
jgi:TRAP transporter TAXI family solute receptor